MDHVLTLIAGPQSNGPLETLAADILKRAARRGEPTWLAEGEAVDIPFDAAAADIPALREAAETMAHEARADAVIQRAHGRRKRLLAADMDSTIIEQECLDEIAAEAGIGDRIAAITERAMRGELDFEAALKERLAMLRGFPASGLETVMARTTLTPGARTLVATMRAQGARCILVSGGFTYFTGAIAARAGFDAHHGNELLFEGGGLAGVAEPILGREEKRDRMAAHASELGIALNEAMAVGDGANDLAMLKAAGMGVAFRAKPAVAAAADAGIRHADLTALLYIQGYARSEFV